jgi:predicted peptidase
MLPKIEATEITLMSHIGDNGILVTSIEYKTKSGDSIEHISADDFEIIIGNKKYGVIRLSHEGDTLKLATDPFPFDGAAEYKDGKLKHNDFVVKCAIETLSFTKEKCKLNIETVDDFISSTYKASNGIELPYWLYMPKGQSNVPLMVWLHGGGEVLETSYKGANLTKNRGATCWIESGKNTAVLSVQFPKNYPFGISDKPEALKMMEAYNVVQYELIQELISEGKIDPRRIYVSGASSGGGGVLRFVMQYPDLFAAALPICAKDTLIPLSEPFGLAYKMEGSLELSEEDHQKCYNDIYDLMQNYDITNVPIWFVHADNDPVCTSYTSKILYDILQKMGAKNNKITLYSNEEMQQSGALFYHASWIPAFNDKEIINWIYKQSK